jgi:D-arabinose 1-dehydrogenase-like Zn-dependent alcohol dehydrogenase
MTTTMRAQRLDTTTGAMTVQDVPVPEPGPGQVLVEVAYCGICHSDLSLADGVLTSRLPVVTQGHEASGTVAVLGPGVTEWAVGDHVVITAGRVDYTCVRCRRGDHSTCMNMESMAFDYDGAFAQYTLAGSHSLTRVPDNVPLDRAALLADAVATPFGALVHTAQIRPGEAVGIWGLGGLGTHMVQLARMIGAAPIIALDPAEDVRHRILDSGADLALDPADPAAADAVRAAAGGAGLDAAFDTSGSPDALGQAHHCLRRGGRLVVVGMSNSPISIGTTAEFGFSKITVAGHHGYQAGDIATLATLVSLGRLDLSRSVSDVLPLERIEEGFQRLRTHEGNPIRILVQPNPGT